MSGRIYHGDGNGGPIDYSVPIGETTGKSFTIAGLAPGSKTWFGVRNYDPDSGMEETNIDAKVLVIVNEFGRNASDRPGSPMAIVAVATTPGTVEVRWIYQGHPSLPEPMQFFVYGNPGSVVDFSLVPLESAEYFPTLRDFQATISGLQSGTQHAFGVRSRRGYADDGNTATALATPKSTPPKNVSGLAGRPTFKA